jgi:hypothetical protein
METFLAIAIGWSVGLIAADLCWLLTDPSRIRNQRQWRSTRTYLALLVINSCAVLLTAMRFVPNIDPHRRLWEYSLIAYILALIWFAFVRIGTVESISSAVQIGVAIRSAARGINLLALLITAATLLVGPTPIAFVALASAMVSWFFARKGRSLS